MAIKTLLAKNFKKLSDQLNDTINYVDIDYNIIEPSTSQGLTHTRTTILRENYAILNAYRLWLQSRRYDYIRDPNFGGFFDNALNDRFQFNIENESAVKTALLNESAEKWPDITILDIEVKCNLGKRSWDIKILAQDKNTKLILADDNITILENNII